MLASGFGAHGRIEVEVGAGPWVEFSETVDVETMGPRHVAIVAWEEVGLCELTPVCAVGICARGRCWDDPLSSSDLRALDNGEYMGGIESERVVGKDASSLELQPYRALGPETRYSLVLGAGVRDLSGAGLVDAWGRRKRWRRDFVTGVEGSSGPQPRMVSPTTSSTGVPTNVSWIETRFSRPLEVSPAATLVFADDLGAAVELNAAEYCPGWVPGYCLRWKSFEWEPNRRYAVTGGSLTDLAGRAVVPAVDEQWFRTASGPDEDPPQFEGLEAVRRAGCLVVEIHVGESVGATLSVGSETTSVVGEGALVLALRVPTSLLGPITVTLRDLAGNQAQRAVESPQKTALVPAVTITEVLANPAGAEPGQEFVELFNFGSTTEALDGLRLADQQWSEVLGALEAGDDPPGDLLPEAQLAPGGIALVVSEKYDPTAMEDPSPPAGALVLRVDTSLGAAGLKNVGEPLSLYLADPPQLVASYGNFVDTSASAHAGRSVSLVRPEACDAEASWQSHPLGRSTPGRLP